MYSILVPTDFSECADNAFNYALNLAKEFDSKVTLLTAYHVHSAGGAQVVLNLEEELRLDSLKALKAAKEKALEDFPNIEIQAFADLDLASNSVIEATERSSYDLVVMGTKGASGIKEVLLGSVTSGVIGKVKTPVLAIPESCKYSAPEKFTLSVDLKKLKNHEPIKFLTVLASKFNATIDVLNVREEPSLDESFELISEAVEIDNDLLGIEHTFSFIESSNIEQNILEQAEKNNSILTVITRERKFFDRIFHRSLSKKLAMHSHVPILILHE